LSALKAFSMWKLAPWWANISMASAPAGLWEARLAREHYKGEIATYCAAYKAEDMAEICAFPIM
jgi:carboxynorspermidine decarboxylase